jgi:hypothetical protein
MRGMLCKRESVRATRAKTDSGPPIPGPVKRRSSKVNYPAFLLLVILPSPKRTFSISNDVHFPPPHSSPNHGVPNDPYRPIPMMPRRIRRQEALARRSDVRVADVGEDGGTGGGVMEDDAGAELVCGAFKAEADEGFGWARGGRKSLAKGRNRRWGRGLDVRGGGRGSGTVVRRRLDGFVGVVIAEVQERRRGRGGIG